MYHQRKTARTIIIHIAKKKPASVNGLNNQFNGMIQISHFRTKADAVHFSATLDKSTIHLLKSLSFFFFLAVLFVPSVFICTSYFLEVDLERTTIKWEKQENAYQEDGQFITASHLKR